MPVTLQPTTLKYKNQNGQFQSATVIKGDKGDQGDAYILTEADKTDIAASVDYSSFIQEVSGSSVTIVGEPNMRYVCGEVTSISITPPSAGSIDVIFTSGSTATVLTLPSTVKMPDWFTSILAVNTVYEILITDGVYGSVMTWQA